MDHKFKVGDLVEAVEAIKNIVIGNIYEVTGVSVTGDFISVKDKGNQYFGILPLRFKLCMPLKKTYKALYKEAQLLKIKHRSMLNKAALEVAIAKHKEQPLPKVKPLGVELIEQVNNKNYTCSFAIEYSDGVRDFQKQAPCHAGLQRQNNLGKQRTKIVFCLNGHLEGAKDKPAYREWVDYIINRSPWKNSFITKDLDEGFTTGFYGNVEESLSRLSCSAIILRQASEFPEALNTWKLIKDKGYSENVACFMASGLTYGTEFAYTGACGAHKVWVNGMIVEDVFKFFNEGWHRATNLSFRSNGGYYQIFNSIASYQYNARPIDLNAWFKKSLRFTPAVNAFSSDVLIQESVWEACEAVKELITT